MIENYIISEFKTRIIINGLKNIKILLSKLAIIETMIWCVYGLFHALVVFLVSIYKAQVPYRETARALVTEITNSLYSR